MRTWDRIGTAMCILFHPWQWAMTRDVYECRQCGRMYSGHQVHQWTRHCR